MRLFLLAFFLLPSFSFAGPWYEMGNGGFIVICPEINLHQTLDINEALVRYQKFLDLKESDTTKKRVAYLISKIEKYNPRRAELYRKWFQTFYDEAELITGMQFSPLPDLGGTFIPKGCTLKQVVFQREPGFLNKYRYTIDVDTWSSLTPLDQAALVMHELIYRELSSAPNYHATSEATRAFNGWLNSEDFEKSSLADYIAKLQRLNIVQAELKGMSIILAAKDTLTGTWSKLPAVINQDNSFSSVVLDGSQPFKTGSLTIYPICSSNDKIQSLGILSTSPTEIYLTPLQGSLNLVSCFSHYRSDDKTFSVFADSWHIRSKDKIQTIRGEYGKPNQAAMIATYGPYTLFAVANFPVTVTFNMNGRQTPDNVSFVGKSCYNPEGSFINIWTETPMDPLIIWDMNKISETVRTLPTCRPSRDHDISM